jgi:hypothetical protein
VNATSPCMKFLAGIVAAAAAIRAAGGLCGRRGMAAVELAPGPVVSSDVACPVAVVEYTTRIDLLRMRNVQ